MYDSTPEFLMAYVSNQLHLLQKDGALTTVSPPQNGIVLMARGVPIDDGVYMMSLIEMPLNFYLTDESVCQSNDAKALVELRPNGDLVITRRTQAFVDLFASTDAQLVDIDDSSTFTKLFSIENLARIKMHISDAFAGKCYDLNLMHNAKHIIARVYAISPTSQTSPTSCLFISEDNSGRTDAFESSSVARAIARIDYYKQYAVPVNENVTPAARHFWAERGVPLVWKAEDYADYPLSELENIDTNMKILQRENFLSLIYKDALCVAIPTVGTPHRYLFTFTTSTSSGLATLIDEFDFLSSLDSKLIISNATPVPSVHLMSRGFVSMFDTDRITHDSAFLTTLFAGFPELLKSFGQQSSLRYQMMDDKMVCIEVLNANSLLVTFSQTTVALREANVKKRESELQRREARVRELESKRTRVSGSESSSMSALSSALSSDDRLSSSCDAVSMPATISVPTTTSVPLVPLPQHHMSMLDDLLSHIVELAANVRNEKNAKAKLYLLQSVCAIRGRYESAGVEAVAQLDAYTLSSFLHEGAIKFFVDISRTEYEFASRNMLVAPQPGIELVMIYGLEHQKAVLGVNLRAFYRNFFYQNVTDGADEFWDDKLGAHAMSFVLRDVSTNRIIAAQTVYLARTILNELVCYVSLVAQDDSAPREEGPRIEKPSKYLASELANFCCSLAERVHVIAQSVGYKYANFSGVMHMQDSKVGTLGRYYWAKHCKLMDPGILMGAQLSLLSGFREQGFVEGDCLFVYKLLSRMPHHMLVG